MNTGDFVKVKTNQRGRPRKWIVERVNNMDGTATVLAFDSSGDRMEVPLLDVIPYPVKREEEVEVTMHRDDTLRGPDDV